MLKLRELRKKCGLTMKELGIEIGVAESTISQYETGKRQPDYETLLKLSEYFGVSVDYLLGREIKEKTPSKIGEGHRPPDEETLRLLEILEDRPDIRYLAAASEKATPEHVEATARMFDELYGGNKDK